MKQSDTALSPLKVNKLPTVTAATILERADSGAEPMRLLATDGQIYWCKFVNNPHGIESVVFELLTSIIGRAIGAPIPQAATVTIPDALRDKRFKDGSHIGGHGFGSLHVNGVIESDEVKHANRDGNPSRLPRLFALSEICMAYDFQVMYQQTDDQRAFGFDFGFWMGNYGGPWDLDFVKRETAESYTVLDWDGITLDTDEMLETRSIVSRLTDQTFHDAARLVPDEWNYPQNLVEDLASELSKRKTLTLDTIDAKIREAA